MEPEERAKPLDVFLSRAIEELQDDQVKPSRTTVVRILEELSDYTAVQNISRNTTSNAKLTLFQQKRDALIAKLGSLDDSGVDKLALDLALQLKEVLATRFYPPDPEISRESLPNHERTRVVIEENVDHTQRAFAALDERQREIRRLRIRRKILSYGPLLRAYYSRLAQPLDENIVEALIAQAQSEFETTLLTSDDVTKARLAATPGIRDSFLLERLDTVDEKRLEQLSDHSLPRAIAFAFRDERTNVPVEEKAQKIFLRIHPEEVTSEQREGSIRTFETLPDIDPEKAVDWATKQMEPLRREYVAHLSLVAETKKIVAKNILEEPLSRKIEDIDLFVLIAFDKASETEELTQETIKRIVPEAQSAAAAISFMDRAPDSSSLAIGDVFTDIMKESSVPTTRALGSLFGLLSEGKRQELVTTHFQNAWNRVSNDTYLLNTKLGRSFVESEAFRLLKTSGAAAFNARAGAGRAGGASSLLDPFIGTIFSNPAVAQTAFGDADQTVIGYFDQQRLLHQNKMLLDRLDKAGAKRLQETFEPLVAMQQRMIFLSAHSADTTNPQSAFPSPVPAQSAYVHTLVVPPAAGEKGKPGSGHVPAAIDARRAILLSYLGRLKKADPFGLSVLYTLHIREQFPQYFSQSAAFVYLQGAGRWALDFAVRRGSRAVARRAAGSAAGFLAKLGLTRAAAMAGYAAGGLPGLAMTALSLLSLPFQKMASFAGLPQVLKAINLDSNTVIALIVVITVALLAIPNFLIPNTSDTLNRILAGVNAPSVGGGRIFICRDLGDGTGILDDGVSEQIVPIDLCRQLARVNRLPPFDCDATPDAPECNFEECNPESDTNGCAVPMQCGGLNCTQGPYPISGYTHRTWNENAVDLSCGAGSFPVTAGHAGTVIFVGWRGGYGNAIMIKDTGGSFLTIYGHLAAFNVSRGQTVGIGAGIGTSDDTGNSTGSHLHYERRDRRAGVCDRQGSSDETYHIFCSAYYAETDVRGMLPASLSNSCPG